MQTKWYVGMCFVCKTEVKKYLDQENTRDVPTKLPGREQISSFTGEAFGGIWTFQASTVMPALHYYDLQWGNEYLIFCKRDLNVREKDPFLISRACSSGMSLKEKRKITYPWNDFKSHSFSNATACPSHSVTKKVQWYNIKTVEGHMANKYTIARSINHNLESYWIHSAPDRPSGPFPFQQQTPCQIASGHDFQKQLVIQHWVLQFKALLLSRQS